MILGDMAPCCAVKHIPHANTADAVFSGESRYADPSRGIALPCLNYLLVCEFCERVVCAMHLPVLGYFIRYVVVVCPQEQVVDVCARRIVAFMKNPKSVGNWAMCQYPRGTMGRDSLINEPELPIPLAVSESLPLPTIVLIKNFYLRPKMLCNRWRAGKSGMMRVDIPHRLTFGMAALVFIPFCNRGISPTPALTFAIGRNKSVFSNPRSVFTCIFGKVWGMIHSVVSPPVAIGHIQGRAANTPPGVFDCLHPSILPQLNEYRNAFVAGLSAP